MKKSTKALIGVIAATSLTIAAVSAIFSGNSVADATGASFNGISNIIKGAAAKTPFTVVELVPDKKMAKFGYLIDGLRIGKKSLLSCTAKKTECST